MCHLLMCALQYIIHSEYRKAPAPASTGSGATRLSRVLENRIVQKSRITSVLLRPVNVLSFLSIRGKSTYSEIGWQNTQEATNDVQLEFFAFSTTSSFVWAFCTPNLRICDVKFILYS
jgi:hypothetical protein